MSNNNELALLQELEDKQALREVSTLFARALDRADGSLLASLFADGAQVSIGAFSGPASEFVAASVSPACAKASAMQPSSRSTWARAAISGTTPPKSACSAAWPCTTEDRICGRSPLRTTAAAVSSQLPSGSS